MTDARSPSYGRARPGHPRLACRIVGKKDVDARHKAGHDGLLLCWRVTLRRLLHQSQRVAVRVGEERHPQIVVVHFGDQMRLAAESHAALLELAYRKRNIGATK